MNLTTLPVQYPLDIRISTNAREWQRVWMNTQLNTISLKKVGWTMNQFSKDFANEITHGRISTPTVLLGEVHSNAQLYEIVRQRAVQTQGTVIVIGHGCMEIPSELFVWKGSVEAFQWYWQGD